MKPTQYPIDVAVSAAFREPLGTWFESNKRELPWRSKTRNPYPVWISEVMLQQTRVDQMLPYYARFLDHFPTVRSLASAPLDSVLLVWEGLGYYSRCRNIHKAAAIICTEFNGVFPTTSCELEKLPGVGPYTAAAIASTVFGEVKPAIDGNIKRVFSRVFSMEESIDSSRGMKLLMQIGEALIDPNMPGRFNEALMELGATVCTPKNPDCDSCPIQSACCSNSLGTQTSYPKRTAKKRSPHYEVAVAVLLDKDGRLFIQRRPESGLLGGLWEFPGGKRDGTESLVNTCLRELLEETGFQASIITQFPLVKHTYSHFKVTITPFVCLLTNKADIPSSDSRWISIDEINSFAFPRANRKIIEQLEQFLAIQTSPTPWT